VVNRGDQGVLVIRGEREESPKAPSPAERRLRWRSKAASPKWGSESAERGEGVSVFLVDDSPLGARVENGVVGALTLVLFAEGATPNCLDTSDWRLSLLLREYIVGLAGVAYDPFHVDLLSLNIVCNGNIGVLEPGWENGRSSILGDRANVGWVGEGGAYIPDSWESSDGAVRAVRRCRTLSHCVRVV
jgi:hypothetical protein